MPGQQRLQSLRQRFHVFQSVCLNRHPRGPTAAHSLWRRGRGRAAGRRISRPLPLLLVDAPPLTPALPPCGRDCTPVSQRERERLVAVPSPAHQHVERRLPPLRQALAKRPPARIQERTTPGTAKPLACTSTGGRAGAGVASDTIPRMRAFCLPISCSVRALQGCASTWLKMLATGYPTRAPNDAATAILNLDDHWASAVRLLGLDSPVPAVANPGPDRRIWPSPVPGRHRTGLRSPAGATGGAPQPY